MVRLAVVILTVVLASRAIAWVHRERQLRRHRRLHWALFDPDRDSVKLTRWVDYILQAFPGIAELSELERPTFDRGDRQASGQAAIALAAERFGYPIGGIDLVIGPHRDLRTAIGVAEVPANPWSWKVEGDQIHFIPGEAPPEGPRRIHLTEAAFDSDDSLAWIAAHEVAHVALSAARLARSGREDEEITDLATVMAGYGAVFSRLRFVEERYTASGGRLGWRISHIGTLSQPAIAYVRELRAQRAAAPVQSSQPPAA
jgi:hypothetical protein